MEWQVIHGGFPEVMVTDLKQPLTPNEKGEALYAEGGKMHLSSNIYDEKTNPDAGLVRETISLAEVSGEKKRARRRNTPIARWWADFIEDVEATTVAEINNERPYVQYWSRYTGDNRTRRVSFRSNFMGEAMLWRVDPLEEGGKHVLAGDMPRDWNDPTLHGTLIAVKGAFMAAEMTVRSKAYNTKDEDVRQFSGTDDAFQKFTGKGVLCLESHGTLIGTPLAPHRSITIWPGCLLAFTKGVEISMISAGKPDLVAEEGVPYLILAKAPEKGAYVFTQSLNPRTFFEQHQPKK